MPQYSQWYERQISDDAALIKNEFSLWVFMLIDYILPTHPSLSNFQVSFLQAPKFFPWRILKVSPQGYVRRML